MLHVPLTVPHALPGVRGPWYCAPGRLHVDTPLPDARLAGYERTLRASGTVRDHLGPGTWTVGAPASADVAFELDDHIELIARLAAARAVVAPFLRRMRADLDQREALGEIVGGFFGPPGQRRVQLTVTIPAARADFATLRRLHAIFGDRGNGGATQFSDDAGGVRVYSAVSPAGTTRIESALRAAGFRFTAQPETFIAVDAPAC
jgi:hypothetical protein